MKINGKNRAVLHKYGRDILESGGMEREKEFMHHGKTSVYEHSVAVTLMCIGIAAFLGIRVNRRALVRGALLHDYYLYDWHVPDPRHRYHGFIHADTALRNAQRDFALGAIEKDMIKKHMFPLNIALPKYRESVILCAADKICATRETVSGMISRARLAASSVIRAM